MQQSVFYPAFSIPDSLGEHNGCFFRFNGFL